MRCRRSFTLGPLLVGLGRDWPGGAVFERCTSITNGLLHSGLKVRLTPWRRSSHESRYLLAGPVLVLMWRL